MICFVIDLKITPTTRSVYIIWTKRFNIKWRRFIQPSPLIHDYLIQKSIHHCAKYIYNRAPHTRLPIWDAFFAIFYLSKFYFSWSFYIFCVEDITIFICLVVVLYLMQWLLKHLFRYICARITHLYIKNGKFM